jgi:hypothetical protein
MKNMRETKHFRWLERVLGCEAQRKPDRRSIIHPAAHRKNSTKVRLILSVQQEFSPIHTTRVVPRRIHIAGNELNQLIWEKVSLPHQQHARLATVSPGQFQAKDLHVRRCILDKVDQLLRDAPFHPGGTGLISIVDNYPWDTNNNKRGITYPPAHVEKKQKKSYSGPHRES